MWAKKGVQYLLQKIFGVNNYLFCFAFFASIRKLLFPESSLNAFVSLASKIEGDILDIGANVGTYSIFLAKKLEDRKIVGFEPLAILVKIAIRVIAFWRIRNATIHPLAFGLSETPVQVITPLKNGVFMHGLTHIITDNEQVELGVKEFVTQQRLDSYYFNSGRRAVAAIKIDVENHELFVIKGGAQLLAEQRPILLIELWENERKQPCIQQLVALGYIPLVFEEGRFFSIEQKHALDYFFIPQERMEIVNLYYEDSAR